MKHIVKNTIFILCLIFSFYSCSKQNKIRELACEKVYIVEWNWTFSEKDDETMFRVAGFSELDKHFNLRFAYRAGDDCEHYYTSNILISDSLKNKISDIIDKYQTDTTCCYTGNGCSRIIIFLKNDNEFIRIYFEPKFLPQDLLFLYNLLYESRQKQVEKNQYTEMFTTFEKIIMSEKIVMSGKGITLPPKETIQFIPPAIKRK